MKVNLLLQWLKRSLLAIVIMSGFLVLPDQITFAKPLSALFTNCASQTEIPQTECEALVALYNSANGAGWIDSSNWLQTSTPCSWEGITCSSGHVSELYLAGKNLFGTIPPELGNLTNLTKLYLIDNQLTGSIPTQLGNLSNLTTLNIEMNQLTGPIPAELGNLSNLKTLAMGWNQLTGSIPPQLGNLTELTYLRLNYNPLSGSIPPELGNLTKLTDLILYDVQLSGPIPTQLGNLTNLTGLYLGENNLTGPIPTQLGNLIQLTELGLNDNQLTGSIPTQLGSLTNLTALWLSGNQLNGEFPATITNLINLSTFEFDCWITSTDPSVIAFIDTILPDWQNNTCVGVLSITRGNPNPTNLSNVDFVVTFSAPVTGVDIADFKLTNTILTGTSVTSVTGTGPYTVTVNTGTGNGTIHLDVPAIASIQDLDGNAFAGPYTGGQTYIVDKGSAPTIPVLVSPANGSLIAGYKPTLDWGDSSPVMALANDWSYEVNVTDGLGSFDQTFNTASGLSNSSYIFTDSLPVSTTFTWKVRAYNDNNQYSEWSATRTFSTGSKLETPVLNLPADGTTENNKRPTFSWDAAFDAATYTLQILQDDKVVVTGTAKAPAHAYTPVVDLLSGTTYMWRVRANNGVNSGEYSDPFTFTTSANPPKIPVLTSPSTNALVDSAVTQTLVWSITPPVSPTAASYEVEYATNSTFINSTVVPISVTQLPISIGTLLPNRTYSWHVRSWSGANATGNHSAWSATRTFRTMLSTPMLNLPTDSTFLDNKRPTFEWDEVPGATTYTLQILYGTKVVNTGTIKVPAYVYTPAVDLLPSSTYTWKVKANGTNTGNYSVPFTFTTSDNSPKIPALSAPANAALVDSTVAQTLDWNQVLGVTATSAVATYPAAACFEVEYAMNSSFSGVSDTIVVVNDNTIAGTHTTPILLSPGRTYSWRVRSWSGTNATGIHSAWSLVRTIKVKFVAPVLDSVVVTSGSPTFVWHSANGLWTNYTLTILDAATNKVVKSFTITAPTTTYTIPAASLPAGTYKWQVKINGLYTPISSAISSGTFTK